MSVQTYYDKHRDCFEHNRPVVLSALKQLGCDTATVTYCGSGDEGSLETPEFTPDICGKTIVQNLRTIKWSEAELVRHSDTIERAVEDIFYSALGSSYGGWENNDGADGEIVWNLQTDTITISHMAYYTESECTETEL